MAQVKGPKVQVGQSDLHVAVTSEYRSGDDFFRGMVTLYLGDTSLLDIEGAVKNGRDGRWVAPPSRQYEDNSGNTKWKNLVWFNSKQLAAACVEAVEKFAGGDAPVDDDDIPL